MSDEVLGKTYAAIAAMSACERAALFDMLRENGVHLCIPAEGVMAEPMAKVEGARKGGGGKRGGGGRRSFWLRTITGFDDSKKKGFRLEGEWVNDPGDVAKGTVLAIGMTTPDEKKTYSVLVADPARDYVFETIGGKKKLDGAALASGPHTHWDAFEAEAKSRIGL